MSEDDHCEAIALAETDMRELNWGSSFVDHEPAHSWWFARKNVRLCPVVLRLVACSLRKIAAPRFQDHPLAFGVDDSVSRATVF